MIEFTNPQGTLCKILTTAEGPYVTNPRIVASISDGSTFFSDNIPTMGSFWIRWKEYLKQNNLKIIGMRLQNGMMGSDGKISWFTMTLPPNRKAYFYINKSRADIGGAANNYIGIGASSEDDPETIDVVWFTSWDGKYAWSDKRKLKDSDIGVIMN